MGIDTYLKLQGGVELIFALVMFAWFVPKVIAKIVSYLIALEMFLITVMVGIDTVTFRDIGLVGAALALGLLLEKESPKTLENNNG